MGTTDPHSVSPKVYFPTMVILAVGLALLIADAIGAVKMDNTIYHALIGSAVAYLGLGYSKDDPARRSQSAHHLSDDRSA